MPFVPRRPMRLSTATWRPNSISGTAGVPPMRAPAGTSCVACDPPAICAPDADLDVADEARLAAHHHEVAELGGAGNARLADDDAMPADHHVVADLHEVIDLGALADHRVLERAAVDAAVGADLHVVLDDDAADLRHLEVTLAAHGEAEAVLADPHARMQDDAVAHQRVRDARPGADVAAPADRHAVAHHGARRHHRAAPDLGLAADDGAGLDANVALQHRGRVHRRLAGGGDAAFGVNASG